jgi:hypothetical protein
MRHFSILIGVLITVLLIASPVLARSGCCSHHGGVCGCGCCDGTGLSNTCAPYYPECNQAAPVYLPTAIPTRYIFPTYPPLPTRAPTRIPTSTPTPTKIVFATIEPTRVLLPTKKLIPKPTKTVKKIKYAKTLLETSATQPKKEGFWESVFHILFR